MRREGSQSKSCTARTFALYLPFLSFPSFPSILFKNQPIKIFSSFALIFALAKDCNNDETEKHDGDGTTHEEDGRRQRHDMRRRPQVRELVALRREGGRRGGKSIFFLHSCLLYYRHCASRTSLSSFPHTSLHPAAHVCTSLSSHHFSIRPPFRHLVFRTSSATAMLPRFPEFMRVSIVNTRPHTFVMERTAASRRLLSAPTEERVSETKSPASSVIVPRATSAITANSFMEACPLSGTRRQPLVPTRQVLPRRTGRVAELSRG